MFSLIFAWMGASASGGGQANPLVLLLPWVMILAVIYFLMIRPQVKRQKAQKAMIEELQKGDKVMAAGGIIGTVAGIKEKENTIILKVDENVKLEVVKTSVSTVIRKE